MRKTTSEGIRCADCGRVWQPLHSEELCPFCEAKRLQGIVDTLPKCWRLNEHGQLVRDVPVVPGMTIWIYGSYGSGQASQLWEHIVYDLSIFGASDGDRYHWPHKDSYSTREAAEAARGT